MSGGVVDGQAVSAGITNPAFLIKNADDSTLNRLGLQRSAAGLLTFTDAQLAISTLMGAGGLSGQSDTAGNTYSSNIIINNGDTWKAALGKLDAAFLASNKKAVIDLIDQNGNKAMGEVEIPNNQNIIASINSTTNVLTLSTTGWTVVNPLQDTLVDNTSTPTVFRAWACNTYAQVYLDFVLTRASGQVRAGRVELINDGTGTTGTSALFESWQETADTGVTFSTDVRTIGGVQEMTLLYATTSTGTSCKILFNYTLKTWPV